MSQARVYFFGYAHNKAAGFKCFESIQRLDWNWVLNERSLIRVNVRIRPGCFESFESPAWQILLVDQPKVSPTR